MIHPTAIIDPRASIAENVAIGAYSVIGADVSIGEDTVIAPHVTIEGPTEIGKHNHIYQFASVGAAPQDKKYAGEPTKLIIGDHNTIREFVTINRGTVQDRGVTALGSHNWIMAYAHIAHDCVLGSHIIMANNASLAGHVHLDDYVILGGFTLIYQFCRIGRNAFTAFGSHVNKDIPPFVMAAGTPAVARGLNLEGLKRNNFSGDDIHAIKQAYRQLFRTEEPLSTAVETCRSLLGENAYVACMLDFMGDSRHGIITTKR